MFAFHLVHILIICCIMQYANHVWLWHWTESGAFVTNKMSIVNKDDRPLVVNSENSSCQLQI